MQAACHCTLIGRVRIYDKNGHLQHSWITTGSCTSVCVRRSSWWSWLIVFLSWGCCLKFLAPRFMAEIKVEAVGGSWLCHVSDTYTKEFTTCENVKYVTTVSTPLIKSILESHCSPHKVYSFGFQLHWAPFILTCLVTAFYETRILASGSSRVFTVFYGN